jgi:hypothetical protein
MAKAACNTLSERVETYKLNNETYPPSIEALAQPQPNGDAPLVPADKLRDPWGKLYQLDPSGPHNNSLKADVFTTTPKGQLVGNFAR